MLWLVLTLCLLPLAQLLLGDTRRHAKVQVRPVLPDSHPRPARQGSC